jgi:hypothetical protein
MEEFQELSPDINSAAGAPAFTSTVRKFAIRNIHTIPMQPVN